MDGIFYFYVFHDFSNKTYQYLRINLKTKDRTEPEFGSPEHILKAKHNTCKHSTQGIKEEEAHELQVQ